MNVNELTFNFRDWYGDGSDGNSPTPDQWSRILGRSPDKPVTLINFFKVRKTAKYADGGCDVSGEEAFSRYSSVSIPTMSRVGGKFLFVGPYQGGFLGEEEDWNLIAIGQYPNLDSLVALYSDETYRSVFHHRSAACERQRVVVCGE
jgi:uncharacterized protein (DUF1330 family)